MKIELSRELEEIRQLSGDGLLHAEQAVAWARHNKNSELYKQLEWQDSVAAEQYRIHQVRQLISVVVTLSPETGRQIRAWISQPSDRVHGGGYRKLNESLAMARQELVAEALTKLRTFANGYTHLPELDPLFRQIEQLVDAFGLKAKAG